MHGRKNKKPVSWHRAGFRSISQVGVGEVILDYYVESIFLNTDFSIQFLAPPGHKESSMQVLRKLPGKYWYCTPLSLSHPSLRTTVFEAVYLERFKAILELWAGRLFLPSECIVYYDVCYKVMNWWSGSSRKVRPTLILLGYGGLHAHMHLSTFWDLDPDGLGQWISHSSMCESHLKELLRLTLLGPIPAFLVYSIWVWSQEFPFLTNP